MILVPAELLTVAAPNSFLPEKSNVPLKDTRSANSFSAASWDFLGFVLLHFFYFLYCKKLPAYFQDFRSHRETSLGEFFAYWAIVFTLGIF
jgi:hypothetical protein